MNRVTIGILLCLGGLILIYKNLWLPGLAAFMTGFLVMRMKPR